MKLPNQKDSGGKGGQKPKQTGWIQLVSNVLTVIIIFLLLSGTYSYLTDSTKNQPEVALSEIASSTVAGLVKKIEVSSDKLTVEFKDGSIKTSKKEAETSLSETLSNYGVPKEKIAAVDPKHGFNIPVNFTSFFFPQHRIFLLIKRFKVLPDAFCRSLISLIVSNHRFDGFPLNIRKGPV